jgi:hypothetical protein
VSYDYELGFFKQPQNLESLLQEFGFKLQRTLGPNRDFPIEIFYYHAFTKGQSRRGVWVVYHDGTYAGTEEIWNRIAPGEAIAALAAAYLLKEFYGALLYDPRKGKPL